MLDYSPNSTCPNCPHKSVRHFCWWNKYVANPIANRGRSDDGKRAMILLKDKVLKSILLRRTKKGRAADLALPPRIVSFLFIYFFYFIESRKVENSFYLVFHF